MKLTLVRHAKAARGGMSDHERPLADVGVRQARELGSRLRQVLTPDIVIYSDAVRATQTAQGLAFDAPYLGLRELYTADVMDVVDAVRFHGKDNTVVVGHEPTISDTAYFLTGDERVGRGVSTATAIMMEGDLQQGGFHIVAIEHVPAREV